MTKQITKPQIFGVPALSTVAAIDDSDKCSAAEAFGGTAAVCYRRICASLQASTPNGRRYVRVALPDPERGY